MQISRRVLVASAAAIGAVAIPQRFEDAGARAQSAAIPKLPKFGYSNVVERARNLATAPFDSGPPLPKELADMPAAQLRQIRFVADKAFFADTPFRMELYHLGGPYKQAATINIIKDGIATPIPYAANLFDYGGVRFERPLPINLGFAGLRLRYPLNQAQVYDELIAFLGASYFRFLGRGQRYGLSARGLAVNAGLPHEEFPFYRELWVQTPAPDADHATIYALLDGPSVTGAYEFTIYPKRTSRLEAVATLFARRAGQKIGFAPLTSMFCSGENDRRIDQDYRPERHDSDGLSMHTGAGEWIWRPLRNPPATEVSSFLDQDIRGFGLLQRDRNFDHYQDIDHLYELEPSYWVEPQGKWGKGRVELIELPTENDTNDNIVASWVSDIGLEPNQPRRIGYVVTARLEGRDPSPNGRVVNTFVTDPPDAPAPQGSARVKRFLVDFADGDLGYFHGEPHLVTLAPSAVGGKIVKSFLVPNPQASGFRAGVDVSVEIGKSSDIRMYLRSEGRALTETWTLPWKAT